MRKLRQAPPVSVVAVLSVVTSAAGGVVASPAVAADAQISVSALGRSGSRIEVTAGVIDLATGRTFTINDGATLKVPAGRYAVGAYISDYPALTVAAREMTVAGATSVVFDTKAAHRVTFDVGDSTVAPTALAAVPVVTAGGKGHKFIPDSSVEWPPGNTYVLATNDSKNVALNVHGVLTGHGPGPSPVRYDIVESVHGMPNAVSFTTKPASLARVDVDVTTLDSDQSTFLKLIPARTDKRPTDGVDLGAPVAAHQITYRTPGLAWDTQLSMSSLHSSAYLEEKPKDNNNKDNSPVYAAGKTYRETWGSGVWGPHPAGPAIYLDNGTLKVIGGPPICAFPGRGVKFMECQVQPQSTNYQLSTRNGKSLGQGGSVEAKVDDSKPQWYVAQLSASRQNEGELSTEITARWYFQAGGTMDTRVSPTETVRSKLQVQPGYLYIQPAGLDEHNRAPGGSDTTLSISALNFPEATAMTLDYSTDGGKSWHPVKLGHTGGSWTGKITNPAAPGKISLRASATAHSGATVSETITNAYGLH